MGGSIIEETLAKLGQIFRANVGLNPYHGEEGHSVAPSLSHQIKGMKGEDPGVTHLNALPIRFYRKTLRQAKLQNDPLALAIAHLLIMALFWCMRLCEYADVNGEQRTLKLCLRNYHFFDND